MQKLFVSPIKQKLFISCVGQIRLFSLSIKTNQFKLCNECKCPFECVYNKKCKSLINNDDLEPQHILPPNMLNSDKVDNFDIIEDFGD
jgi:hypothetical protein